MAVPVFVTDAMQFLNSGDIAAVEAICRVRLADSPNDAWAVHLLGLAAHRDNRAEEAITLLRRATFLNSTEFEFYNNLGAVCGKLGHFADAVSAFERAAALCPKNPDVLRNLIRALDRAGDLAGAERIATAAAALRHDDIATQLLLAGLLRRRGKLIAAIAIYRAILEREPTNPRVLADLAVTFEESGRAELALAYYQRLIELRPNDPGPHSSLLYTLLYQPNLAPESLWAEHARWVTRHAAGLYPPDTGQGSFPNDPNPNRRLRVGYISADFRSHSVSAFLEPLIAGHDPGAVEVYCYSDVREPDDVTARVRAAASVWRVVAGMADADLAALIRQDRIDVLVDPTGHMAGNRLLVFARKPAPVQVAYNGYPATTGLRTMDYFITDDIQHPPSSAYSRSETKGNAEEQFTERLLRLAGPSRCYRPPAACPPITPPPCIRLGHATFGSFNRPPKFTDPMIRLWASLLRKVAGSRLLVVVGSGTDQIVALEHGPRFADCGVDLRRTTFIGRRPLDQYMNLYNQVDVALDTFPYNGVTTTCDALWMGLPTVTLAGSTCVSRVGASVLTHAGLADLVASSPAEYVSIAVRLARNPARLAQLHRDLRNQLNAKGLTDAKSHAAALEYALRRAWKAWCVAEPSPLTH